MVTLLQRTRFGSQEPPETPAPRDLEPSSDLYAIEVCHNHVSVCACL